jgi:hypothetical protein
LALKQGDYPAARALLEESLTIRQELGIGRDLLRRGLAAVVVSQRDSRGRPHLGCHGDRERAIGTPLPYEQSAMTGA